MAESLPAAAGPRKRLQLEAFVDRWHADLSSEAVRFLRGTSVLIAILVNRSAWPLQLKGEYVFAVQVACCCISGVGFIIALAILGAMLGSMIGAISGFAGGIGLSVFTFGFSLVLSPFICMFLGITLGTAFGIFVGIRSCALWLESSLLYHPREYSDGEIVEETDRWCLVLGLRHYSIERINYSLQNTFRKNLEQHAVLLLPEGQEVEHLWIVFGGNGMLALDWTAFLQCLFDKYDGDGIGFLLVDYPGYGSNAGLPGPSSVFDASFAAVLECVGKFEKQPKIHLLGHSLGAAAAAQLAVRLTDHGGSPGQLVMSAPFLHIPGIAVHFVDAGISSFISQEIARRYFECHALRSLLETALWLILPHIWDNVRTVSTASQDGWQICILHGTQDAIVPVSMGRRLATLNNAIEFVEEQLAGHNDVLAKTLAVHARLIGLTRIRRT